MSSGLTIVNSIDFEPYLDRIKGNDWQKEQHRQAYIRIFQVIEQKIKAEFEQKPNLQITLELYGTMPSWKLRIIRCPFYYCPLLWIKLWLFMKKVRKNERWTTFSQNDPTSNF